MTEIDPVEYGKLLSKVDHLEASVSKLGRDVEQLLELANRSRGGFWAGMTIAASLGGIVTWVSDHLMTK